MIDRWKSRRGAPVVAARSCLECVEVLAHQRPGLGVADPRGLGGERRLQRDACVEHLADGEIGALQPQYQGDVRTSSRGRRRRSPHPT
jgi:hypothetical protein